MSLLIKIVAVVVGFVLWSLIFVGGEQVTKAIAPTWAVEPEATFVDSIPLLLTYLARSVVASICAGFVTALISKDNNTTPFVLAFIFLIVGLLVQISAWNLLPVWYHVVFIFLLIPMTMLGARLKTFD